MLSEHARHGAWHKACSFEKVEPFKGNLFRKEKNMNDPEDPRVPVPAPSECRREKCAARRTAILDAALEEFSRQGFAAARMEDIARRARVSKGSLYLYFPTKKALFQGVIEEGFRPFFEHKQALLRDTSLSPRDKLLQMYAPLITGGPDSPLRRCVRLAFSEGLHDPELMGGFYESFLAPNTARLREEFLPAARAPNVHAALDRFPLLLMAPLLFGVLRDDLFASAVPQDLLGLFSAHLDILFPDAPVSSPSGQPDQA